jgi:hypothetical protein
MVPSLWQKESHQFFEPEGFFLFGALCGSWLFYI